MVLSTKTCCDNAVTPTTRVLKVFQSNQPISDSLWQRWDMLERAITPEIQATANELSAAGDEYQIAAAELKDDLVDQLREDPAFMEHVRSYKFPDNGPDLNAALDRWAKAYSVHRSASHAFLRAIGQMT
jgi:hypothetical protein